MWIRWGSSHREPLGQPSSQTVKFCTAVVAERGAGGERLERRRGEQTELGMFSRESRQDGSEASGLGFGGLMVVPLMETDVREGDGVMEPILELAMSVRAGM